MKTYKNLYPTITSFENLYQAFKKAARGKRGQANCWRLLGSECWVVGAMTEAEAVGLKGQSTLKGAGFVGASGVGRAVRALVCWCGLTDR